MGHLANVVVDNLCTHLLIIYSESGLGFISCSYPAAADWARAAGNQE